MIFSGQPLEWRTHASPDNSSGGLYASAGEAVEILKTARYLLWARWTEACPS
jgi:hypothetical protein